jgi:hypothetical protein
MGSFIAFIVGSFWVVTGLVVFGWVLTRSLANTNFGAVQVSDGYSGPTALLPGNGEAYPMFLAGAQTTGTEKLGFMVAVAGTITDVRAYLTAAPTTSSFIVDVMKNGVTLFTTSANRPTIAATANASSTTLPDIVSVAVGDRIRVDII